MNKHDSSIAKYKGVLEKQIIPKILGTYMQRPEEKKIISDVDGLVNLLNEAKDGKYREEKVYYTLYHKITNSQFKVYLYKAICQVECYMYFSVEE